MHSSLTSALRTQEETFNAPYNKSARGYYPFHPDEFAVSFTPIRAGMFSIYLFGPIEEPEQFISAIEVLNAAGENDLVEIHLSTPGGSLSATDTFIDAMRNSEARICVRATGNVCSAGTIILMNADEFTLSENFTALIHNGSVGFGAKFSDWKSETKHTQMYMERILRTTYEGFLSDEEIELLIDGKDYWLDAEAWVERYEARNNYLKDKFSKLQDDALSALLAQQEQPVEEVKKPKRKAKAKTETVEA